MTETNDPNDTQVIKPRRVFKCRNHETNLFMDRKGVWKDHDGAYRCGTCGGVVEDVTDTTTGRSCLSFLML